MDIFLFLAAFDSSYLVAPIAMLAPFYNTPEGLFFFLLEPRHQRVILRFCEIHVYRTISGRRAVGGRAPGPKGVKGQIFRFQK